MADELMSRVFVWYEWRYWLLGIGWRTARQLSLIEYRWTLFVGPVRLSFWRRDDPT